MTPGAISMAMVEIGFCRFPHLRRRLWLDQAERRKTRKNKVKPGFTGNSGFTF